MDRHSESEAAAGVRRRVVASMPGTFLRVEEFAASCDTAEAQLRLLVLEGELVEVWSGLFYRGVSTRFGMTRPSLLDTAVAVAGLGSGPAGVAAAHMLGLTTQVPGIVGIAVAGRVPASMFGFDSTSARTDGVNVDSALWKSRSLRFSATPARWRFRAPKRSNGSPVSYRMPSFPAMSWPPRSRTSATSAH